MEQEPFRRQVSLLPAGWAKALVILAVIMLGFAYWLGLRADSPDHAPQAEDPPTETAPGEPAGD